MAVGWYNTRPSYINISRIKAVSAYREKSAQPFLTTRNSRQRNPYRSKWCDGRDETVSVDIGLCRRLHAFFTTQVRESSSHTNWLMTMFLASTYNITSLHCPSYILSHSKCLKLVQYVHKQKPIARQTVQH